MQAIIVPRRILQQQWGRSRLRGTMAAIEKIDVSRGKPGLFTQSFAPAVGDRSKRRVEGGAQGANDIGQRIGEILVFAAPEAVPSHVDMAAESAVIRI